MPIKISKNTITPSLGKIDARFQLLPKDAFRYWRSITPVKSGNARRKTKLVAANRFTADYNYAVPLDQGLSKQAPKGMSEPTEKYIKKQVKKLLRK
jgi:hypothetical protein